MKNKFWKMIIPLLFLSVFVIAFNTMGMDSTQRLAIIKGLKLKGIVGENNKGMLEFRSGDKKAEAVVEEENSNRLKIYKETAQKSGLSVDAVGAQRAAQIAKEESSEVWLQDENGKWYQKK